MQHENTLVLVETKGSDTLFLPLSLLPTSCHSDTRKMLLWWENISFLNLISSNILNVLSDSP